MKKYLLACVTVIVFTFSAYAQRIYSPAYLANASELQLQKDLKKAFKMKKTGTILSIAGPISAVTGLVMFTSSWSGNFGGAGTADAGLLMLIGGAGATAIGLPIAVAGKIRVEKINRALANKKQVINIKIQPCTNYDYVSQNINPGVALKFCF